MDIKEAMGYVQAVADNCNDAPRYQRALQTVLNYAEASFEEQNRLILEIEALNRRIDEMQNICCIGVKCAFRSE
jgi:AmiR/NasT family two-component response regulator